MRNKILRSANAKYHYSYLFFYKINKGDLHLMYSWVFWREFIDLVGFFGCYCLTNVTLFIISSSVLFTFYLFQNWFSTPASEDRKYVCRRRLYTCINTRKYKGLDSREVTSLHEIKKVLGLSVIQWTFITPDHGVLLILKIFIFFFDHSVVRLLAIRLFC